MTYILEFGINNVFIYKVKHSQRTTATPLHPWIILAKSGVILCAHCNCIVG